MAKASTKSATPSKKAPGASSNFKSALSQLNKLWKAGKDKALGVPEGEYIMKLTKAEFTQSSKGNWGTKRAMVVLAGENSGSEVRDWISFDTDLGPMFTAQFIDEMGYEVPDDVGDFPDVLAGIAAEGVVFRAEVVKSGDFLNVRIKELIDPEDLEEVLEAEGAEEEEEEGDEEEEAEEDEEGEEEEEGDEEEEEEGDEEEEEAEEDGEEEEEESDEDAELHAELVSLAAVFNIPDISDENSIEEITAVFTEQVEWDRDQLSEEEAALLESIGAIEKVKKKVTKTAPVKTAATKSKAPVKTAAGKKKKK